ncbi:MAG TPA: Cna B-type domain-containing protein, partial [Candidatus Mediterraneibacter vanvlietii]|nr:Cna B-type domain-containing protein [Candidatus Mediterraneibacter vanvlietii]
KVEYTVNGNKDSAPYPKPVIQVQEPQITTTSIKVEKVWEDDFESHDPVEVVLIKSDGAGDTDIVGTKTLSADNNWKEQWDDLELQNGTTEYSYTVQEVNIPENYQCSISQSVDPDTNITNVTITNTYDPNTEDLNYYIVNTLQYDDLTVQKVWEDSDNALEKRPDEIGITISENGNAENVHNITLVKNNVSSTDTNMWETTVKVPKFKEDTNSKYDAEEHLELNSDYQQKGDCAVSGDGKTYTFTNELKSTQITVNKVWNDNDLDKRPTSISFKLEYRDAGSQNETDWKPYGEQTYTLTANTWETTIDNLPAVYEYRVVEINTPAGYISKVDGYTITNTLKWTAVKTNKPLPGEEEDAVGLEGALFELKDSSNNVIATGESGEDGSITWKKDGKEVVLDNLNDKYTITETRAPAGYMIHEGGWNVVFENGVLTKFDNGDVFGDAEKGVVINLENEMLYELPETGGSGIYWYMLGGVLLMMAGSLLVYKKRRGEVLRRK